MSVLITIRKSHTNFRLLPTLVTLNGVIALILRFTEFDSFAGQLRHTVASPAIGHVPPRLPTISF